MAARQRSWLQHEDRRFSALSQRVPSAAEKTITRGTDVDKGKNQQRQVVVLSRHLLGSKT